jgi:hypothetical protein
MPTSDKCPDQPCRTNIPYLPIQEGSYCMHPWQKTGPSAPGSGRPSAATLYCRKDRANLILDVSEGREDKRFPRRAALRPGELTSDFPHFSVHCPTIRKTCVIWPISLIEISHLHHTVVFLVIFAFHVDWKDCSDVWLACGQACIQVPSCDHSTIEKKGKATDGKSALWGAASPPAAG